MNKIIENSLSILHRCNQKRGFQVKSLSWGWEKTGSGGNKREITKDKETNTPWEWSFMEQMRQRSGQQHRVLHH